MAPKVPTRTERMQYQVFSYFSVFFLPEKFVTGPEIYDNYIDGLISPAADEP